MRVESFSAGDGAAGVERFLLTDDQVRDQAGLRALVETLNAGGGTYHQLDLLPTLRVEGDYDMRRYVGAYRIPERLDGLRVLDVGTSAGYLALECARRGGSVTAIDIWDATPGGVIGACTDLDVTYVRKSIYDLDASFGEFDVVVCGSLLLHLPDQLGAISALRKVCRGRLCISTACTVDSGTSERALCEFTAARAEEADYYTFWQLSAAALERMLLIAGFARIDNRLHFVLESNEGRRPFSTPHVVMTAHVG